MVTGIYIKEEKTVKAEYFRCLLIIIIYAHVIVLFLLNKQFK